MVPVSLWTEDGDQDANGNKVGAILCNLATDVADPIERLRVVSESMCRRKEIYNSLSSIQVMARTRRPGAVRPREKACRVKAIPAKLERVTVRIWCTHQSMMPLPRHGDTRGMRPIRLVQGVTCRAGLEYGGATL
jgi:hypothetical protein